VVAGQAVYNRWTLAAYDVVVLGLSCSLVWRCPSRTMTEAHSLWTGPRHLELGVGTGYFLDRARPAQRPEVVLVDLDPTALRTAAARISRLQPTTVQANVLEPLPVTAGAFDSVGLDFVLHCLPGSWPEKGAVLGHAAQALRPGGRLFGSTILAEGVPVGRTARALMGLYQSTGVFSNAGDDLAGLDRELGRHVADHRITVRGCVALFEATTA
jgi:SAM-dependent methyltransferase